MPRPGRMREEDRAGAGGPDGVCKACRLCLVVDRLKRLGPGLRVVAVGILASPGDRLEAAARGSSFRTSGDSRVCAEPWC